MNTSHNDLITPPAGKRLDAAHDLEDLREVKLPVLDLDPPDYENCGHIMLIDWMGRDSHVVREARQSYGKGTVRLRSDRNLLRYLMRHRHTTPFEQCVAKFHIQVPMDCWRQYIRHRTMSVNEYSTRYSEAIDLKARTAPDAWRSQSKGNRQGSGGRLAVPVGERLSSAEAGFHAAADRVYRDRLDAGVAREQARKDLPLSTYTKAVFTMNLHNLLHFAELRLDEHAQQEIKGYAQVIGAVLAKWVPDTWQAFLDYRFYAVYFSVQEQALLKNIVVAALELENADKVPRDTEALADMVGDWRAFLPTKREADEFLDKLDAVCGTMFAD